MKAILLKLKVWNLTLITILLFSALSFSSCKKEDDNENYYVNYIIHSPGPYGRFRNWTATTPEGLYENDGYNTSSWNKTFGPVEKGFRCSVKIGNYQGETPTIEIHISKNNEPFSLKKIVDGTSATYIIDY